MAICFHVFALVVDSTDLFASYLLFYFNYTKLVNVHFCLQERSFYANKTDIFS